MLEWAGDLKVRDTDLYLDSRRCRAVGFVSHAHTDHVATHDRAIATAATAALSARCLGRDHLTQAPFDEVFDLDKDTRLCLLPAGHILGSAMLHVTRPQGALLYTGDFKLRHGLSVEPARPCRADVLVMESTFGRPAFRFPSRQLLTEQLLDLVETAFRAGRQPIVLGYSLGKAQEAMRVLSDGGFNVCVHESVAAPAAIYERFGVKLGNYRTYAAKDFHGPAAMDLRQRGVLVGPPQLARQRFCTAFASPCRIVLTGWAMGPGTVWRYGVEHALPLSDHADFDELLELIDMVHPRKIYTHHGDRAFADELQRRGHDAVWARQEGQLTLFP